MSEETQGSWIKSGAFSLFEKGAGLIFGLGSLFILVRIYIDDKTTFGLWLTFGIVCAIIDVGRAGLQQNALVKYLSAAVQEKNKKEQGLITTASLFNNIIITAIVICVLYFLGSLIESVFKDTYGLAELLKIYCLTSFFLMFFQQFNFVQQSFFKFDGIFWSNLVYKGSFFAFVLFLYFRNEIPPLSQLAWFQVFAAIAAALVSWLFTRKFWQFATKLDFNWVKALFNFGIFGFGTNMSTMLHKNLDRIMLGSLIGPAALAVYEWAVRLTLLIEVPTFSVASVVYPKSSQRVANGDHSSLKELYEKSVGAILAIILPFVILVFLLAYPIILILATSAYVEAVPVLRITMIFALFIPYAVMFGTVIDSMGKPKLNFIFTAAGFLINIVANYICITNFGVIGAAYGTLFSWGILTIAGQIVLYNLLGVIFYKPFTHIIPFYKNGAQRLMLLINDSVMPKEKRV